MDMLSELRAQEKELDAVLSPIAEQYYRVSTELHMVRAGIEKLTSKKRGRIKGVPTSWTQDRVEEAEALKASGLTWAGVGKALGSDGAVVGRAVNRAKLAARLAAGNE